MTKQPTRKHKDKFNKVNVLGIFRALCRMEPVFEHRFHPVRKWRFDIAFPEYKIALEVEGGIWGKSGSRHTHPAGFKADCEKYNTATAMGWSVFRCLPEQVESKAVRDWIRACRDIKAVQQ